MRARQQKGKEKESDGVSHAIEKALTKLKSEYDSECSTCGHKVYNVCGLCQ